MFFPIVPPVPVVTPEGEFIGPVVDVPEEDIYVPILSELGDLIKGTVDGIGAVVDFAVSAFEGACDVLEYIADFIPSYSFFERILPSGVFEAVMIIIGVCASLITFKVVSYFA